MGLEDMLARRDLDFIDFKIRDYGRALNLQENLRTKRVNGSIPDTVVMVEHDPVYTMGRSTSMTVDRCIRKMPLPAPLYHIDRGGRLTYHGPGQQIGYFIHMVPLDKIGNFHEYLEWSVNKSLNDIGVPAYSRKAEIDEWGKPMRGAWCDIDGDPKKVGAVGFSVTMVPKLKSYVTMHGVAINLNASGTGMMKYFSYINPCGEMGSDVSTAADLVLGSNIDMEEFRNVFLSNVKRGYE